jgi:Protein of unknown function (DUF3551)
LRAAPFDLQKLKEEKMKSTSTKLTASAATLFTTLFFVMTAPTAHADDYCITGGAQAAHGCGYPTMEACQAASAGIGGTCGRAGTSNTPANAMGYQQKKPHSKRASSQEKTNQTSTAN